MSLNVDDAEIVDKEKLRLRVYASTIIGTETIPCFAQKQYDKNAGAGYRE